MVNQANVQTVTACSNNYNRAKAISDMAVNDIIKWSLVAAKIPAQILHP